MTTPQKPSSRACSDPRGNFTIDPNTNKPVHNSLSGGKGCQVCDNDDRYGFGKSTCGKCGRCHGCGSSNNGIGPLQAVYFGGKKVVSKAGEMLGGGGGGGGGGGRGGGSEGASAKGSAKS